MRSKADGAIVTSSCRMEQSGPVGLFVRHYGCPGAADGVPVLLIHGACVDSDFFDGPARVLARNHEVVSYDRRGYGRSVCPDGVGHALAVQAEDAACVVRRAFQGEPVLVVAHSAGCVVALELAARFPGLVQGMMLYEPAVMDCLPVDDEVFARIGRALADARSGLRVYGAYQLLSLEHMEDERARPSLDGGASRRDANIENFVSREAQGVYRARFDYEALRASLEERRIPVFVGIGERSLDTYHARNCPVLARRLGGRLVYFPGGHNCPSDLPLEFSALVEGLVGY